ncbi:MAG: helix-turn-helix domain-containing protein [Candidatus Thermoplasmatota archaeon]
MSDLSIDELLAVVENPTRRMILRELVRERMYPLQLSRELRISQQAILKHLRVLEESALVKVVREKSDRGGPPRRAYSAARMFTITIDVGPGIFNEGVRVFEEPAMEGGMQRERGVLPRGSPVGAFKQVLVELGEISEEMEKIERRRAELLRRKEWLRRSAYDLVSAFCTEEDARRVLRHVIEEGRVAPEAIAEALDMRERRVEEVLAELAGKGLMEVIING